MNEVYRQELLNHIFNRPGAKAKEQTRLRDYERVTDEEVKKALAEIDAALLGGKLIAVHM